MARTRVKVCGIVRPADAVLAAQAGADAIGMVFHPPAKRGISIDQARKILGVLPPFVTPVGLFVDAPTQRIVETCAEVGVSTVQLHGSETPEQVAELRGLRVLKVIGVGDRFVQELEKWDAAIGRLGLRNLAGLVLDTAGPTGGSGVANDWEAIQAQQVAGAFAALPPVIVAGGLTPETVRGVVELLRPWAVDVSSGVEEAVGEKSREKMEAFVSEVKAAKG